MKTSLILLAGGTGQRMGAPIPKQFLPLAGKEVALHSLETLLQTPELIEVIVVCAPAWRHVFTHLDVKYALPGVQRQDSVYNGLEQVSDESEWVCIHDSARPFLTLDRVESLFLAAKKTGAASLAVPVKNTLKEVLENKKVAKTLDRSKIWEIQTPQLLKKEILVEGFSFAKKHGLEVTDDVSLAELIGQPVQLVMGGYQNIKITTPEDLIFAEWQVSQPKNLKCALPMMELTTAAGKYSPIASPSKA